MYVHAGKGRIGKQNDQWKTAWLAAWFRIGLHALPAWRPLTGCVRCDGRLADVPVASMMLAADAGWVLAVFRFSMAVFFVMGLITALFACVHVALDVGGGEARKFFGYGRFRRDCLRW